MAATDWAILTASLDVTDVRRGVTAGQEPPPGGGDFVYAMNSLTNTAGSVALAATQASFAPATSGGRISGAIKHGVSGGAGGFAPFLFAGLQSNEVAGVAYMLGLSSGDPYHLELRKGALTGGLPDAVPAPATAPHLLLRSTNSFDPDLWHHLRLDVIVQGSGDVLLKVRRNDVDAHDVDSPVWVTIPGMEGPGGESFDGYVDDALGVNTGSVPLVGGYFGFGCTFSEAARRAYFDHMQIARQL